MDRHSWLHAKQAIWDSQKFLLDQGADPKNGYSSSDYESLVWAILGSNSSQGLVDLLLARGTVVVMGSGTLIAAAEHGNLGAVKLLLEHGKRTGDLDLDLRLKD